MNTKEQKPYNNMKRRPFTESEWVFVKANYGKMSNSDIAKAINRTKNAVKSAAFRLQVQPKLIVFTSKMEQRIRESYPSGDIKALGNELGVNRLQLYKKANQMGLKRKAEPNISTEHLDFVSEKWGKMKPVDIAAELGLKPTQLDWMVKTWRKMGYEFADMRGKMSAAKAIGEIVVRMVKGVEREFLKTEYGWMRVKVKKLVAIGEVRECTIKGVKRQRVKTDKGWRLIPINPRYKPNIGDRRERLRHGKMRVSTYTENGWVYEPLEPRAKKIKRGKPIMNKVKDGVSGREAKRPVKAPKRAPKETVKLLPNRDRTVIAIVRGFRDGRVVDKAEIEREHNITSAVARMEGRGLKVVVEKAA